MGLYEATVHKRAFHPDAGASQLSEQSTKCWLRATKLDGQDGRRSQGNAAMINAIIVRAH